MLRGGEEIRGISVPKTEVRHQHNLTCAFLPQPSSLKVQSEEHQGSVSKSPTIAESLCSPKLSAESFVAFCNDILTT